MAQLWAIPSRLTVVAFATRPKLFQQVSHQGSQFQHSIEITFQLPHAPRAAG
jgi:hypothetical protein